MSEILWGQVKTEHDARTRRHFAASRMGTRADLAVYVVNAYGSGARGAIRQDETRSSKLTNQHLNHLLERYQAGASYLPVNWEEPVYAGYRTRLKVVRVRADVVTTKFKLGQTTPPESLARILNALNTRGGALDLHTAALIASAQSSRS